ncbi:MliC family protein [Algiphilus sp.]|uniref:MliC family protein n=1 Tax=Algiphilus sp. TaxID=1872431 RepID=UPI003B51B662
MKNTSRHACASSLTTLIAISLGACSTMPPRAADVSEAVQAQHWRCGEMLLESQNVDEALILRLPGGDHRLTPEAAASGARYSNADGVRFWSKGSDEALLWRDAEAAPLDCRPSEQRSPWLQAQSEGVRLRATGNEPGWLLEAHADGSLVLWLDYGQRRLSLATEQPLTGPGLYTAKSGASDRELTIEVMKRACTDSMSGTRFPLQLRVLREDASPLEGCGRAYAAARNAGA